MGLIKKVAKYFKDKKVRKDINELGTSYLYGVEGLMSTIQVLRAVDRQWHKELFSSTAKLKATEINAKREEIDNSIKRYSYILDYLSNGKINMDTIKTVYDPKLLDYYKELSLNKIPDTINLIVQTLVSSIFTNMVYTQFDHIYKNIDVNKELVIDSVDNIFKDEEKNAHHFNVLMSTLNDEFGMDIDKQLSLQDMAYRLIYSSQEYPDGMELLLNRPCIVELNEEGLPIVML